MTLFAGAGGNRFSDRDGRGRGGGNGAAGSRAQTELAKRLG